MIYLVIGIFLAIGATYVYATWDTARTGGSGQLSETNWNELVTMIENNIGAGGVTWMGYTASSYTGNMGGTKGMNAICNTSYPGSHACTWDEIIKLGTSYPWTGNAWMVDGQYAISSDSYRFVYTKDGGSANATAYNYAVISPNCAGWTSSSTSNTFGSYITTGGKLQWTLCDVSYPCACCK